MTRQAKESEGLADVDSGKGHKQLAQLVGKKRMTHFSLSHLLSLLSVRMQSGTMGMKGRLLRLFRLTHII